jgi:hypothetical protein
MQPKRNLEAELEDINLNLADATMLGDEREIVRLQTQMQRLYKEIGLEQWPQEGASGKMAA